MRKIFLSSVLLLFCYRSDCMNGNNYDLSDVKTPSLKAGFERIISLGKDVQTSQKAKQFLIRGDTDLALMQLSSNVNSSEAHTQTDKTSANQAVEAQKARNEIRNCLKNGDFLTAVSHEHFYDAYCDKDPCVFYFYCEPFFNSGSGKFLSLFSPRDMKVRLSDSGQFRAEVDNNASSVAGGDNEVNAALVRYKGGTVEGFEPLIAEDGEFQNMIRKAICGDGADPDNAADFKIEILAAWGGAIDRIYGVSDINSPLFHLKNSILNTFFLWKNYGDKAWLYTVGIYESIKNCMNLVAFYNGLKFAGSYADVVSHGANFANLAANGIRLGLGHRTGDKRNEELTSSELISLGTQVLSYYNQNGDFGPTYYNMMGNAPDVRVQNVPYLFMMVIDALSTGTLGGKDIADRANNQNNHPITKLVEDINGRAHANDDAHVVVIVDELSSRVENGFEDFVRYFELLRTTNWDPNGDGAFAPGATAKDALNRTGLWFASVARDPLMRLTTRIAGYCENAGYDINRMLTEIRDYVNDPANGLKDNIFAKSVVSNITNAAKISGATKKHLLVSARKVLDGPSGILCDIFLKLCKEKNGADSLVVAKSIVTDPENFAPNSNMRGFAAAENYLITTQGNPFFVYDFDQLLTDVKGCYGGIGFTKDTFEFLYQFARGL